MKGNKKHINKLYLDACNSKHDELMLAENVFTHSQIYFKLLSNNIIPLLLLLLTTIVKMKIK